VQCTGCSLVDQATRDWTRIDLVDGSTIAYCPICAREAIESVDDRCQPHPFRYFSHCATCASERPYTPREAKSWNRHW
jgi:formate dehydrogenase maturation protein FdhE